MKKYRIFITAAAAAIIIFAVGYFIGNNNADHTVSIKTSDDEGNAAHADDISGSGSLPDITSGANQKTESADNRRLVNINDAPAGQLENLPGIGAETAQAIIEYRTKNGPFTDISDIMNVDGIGEATYSKIKDIITVYF